MKGFIKRGLSLIFLIALIFTGSLSVEAKTLAQLKSELSSVEAKYQSNQNEKAQTESEIASTKNKINALNQEKVKIQEDITNLNEELERLKEDIEKMQKEMKAIINYYQLSSTNSIYLEYAFNATSFTDFIYRLAVAEQLSEYRKTTIDKYNKLIEENKKKLEELASKQVSLNNLEKELSAQLTKLGSNLASISEAAVDIKDEIADLKAQIKKYESTYKCGLNEEISTCTNRYFSSIGNGSLPSADGFYRPVTAGRVNANYGYTGYYGSNFHYGIDIGVSHGTPVYSVAEGRVAKIFYKGSCGGNMVHIAHRVNGRNYTSQYAHLASIAVREGDIVTQNTIIGYSGGVPSIETWDGCSTGAHLHLQLATGAYMTDYFWYSDFQSRSFDPRNIINFPSWGSYFSGR